MLKIATLSANQETGEGSASFSWHFARMDDRLQRNYLIEARCDLERLVSLAHRHYHDEIRRGTDKRAERERRKSLLRRHKGADSTGCALVMGSDGGGSLVVSPEFLRNSWLFILDVAGDWKGEVERKLQSLESVKQAAVGEASLDELADGGHVEDAAQTGSR